MSDELEKMGQEPTTPSGAEPAQGVGRCVEAALDDIMSGIQAWGPSGDGDGLRNEIEGRLLALIDRITHREPNT